MNFYYLPSCTVAYKTPEEEFPRLDIAKIKEHVNTWDSQLDYSLPAVEQPVFGMLQNVTDLLMKSALHERYYWSDELSDLADIASTIDKIYKRLPSENSGKKACLEQAQRVHWIIVRRVIKLYDEGIKSDLLNSRGTSFSGHASPIPILLKIKILEDISDKIIDFKRIVNDASYIDAEAKMAIVDSFLKQNVSNLKAVYNGFTPWGTYEQALTWAYMDKLTLRPITRLSEESPEYQLEIELQEFRNYLKGCAACANSVALDARKFIDFLNGSTFNIKNRGDKKEFEDFKANFLKSPFLMDLLIDFKTYNLESNEKVEKALDFLYNLPFCFNPVLLKVGDSYQYRHVEAVIEKFIRNEEQSELPFIGLLHHYFHPRFKENYNHAIEMFSKETILRLYKCFDNEGTFIERFNKLPFEKIFPKEEKVSLTLDKDQLGLFIKLSQLTRETVFRVEGIKTF